MLSPQTKGVLASNIIETNNIIEEKIAWGGNALMNWCK